METDISMIVKRNGKDKNQPQPVLKFICIPLKMVSLFQTYRIQKLKKNQ